MQAPNDCWQHLKGFQSVTLGAKLPYLPMIQSNKIRKKNSTPEIILSTKIHNLFENEI